MTSAISSSLSVIWGGAVSPDGVSALGTAVAADAPPASDKDMPTAPTLGQRLSYRAPGWDKHNQGKAVIRAGAAREAFQNLQSNRFWIRIAAFGEIVSTDRRPRGVAT
jgi:hypothetical protein